MAAIGMAVSRVPLEGESVEDFIEVVKKVPSYMKADLSKPLRLNKIDFNVPTLDQLARAEKLHMLRKCGFQVTSSLDCMYSPVKCIKKAISLFGECKYFTYMLRLYQNRGKNRAVARVVKKERREAEQLAWFAGGREAAYKAKYRFGNTEHLWFAKGLYKATGCLPTVSRLDVDFSAQASEDFGVPCHRPVRRYINTEKSDRAQARKGRCHLPVPTPPSRSIMLLYKIRAIRKQLRVAPTSVWRPCPTPAVVPKWSMASPQMEGADGDTLNTVSSGNVVLTEANPSGHAVAAQNSFRFDWHQLCSSETDTSYDYLLNRWTLCKTGEWQAQNQGTNFELTDFKFDLPYDIAKKHTDGSMPLCVPFKIFKYYRGDIEIKIHINSNKFQIGQLQLSWQYLEKFDGNKLDNIYSRSQLPHVLVNAGASNEATLTIPYKFVQPYMHTSQRTGALDALYLGTVRLFVVVPLLVGASGPQSCGVSMYVRFPNSSFTGMRDGGIADPQMEAAAAAMVTSAVVNKFIGDKNCDNPTNTSVPKYLVPTGAHSFAHGTGVSEALHTLRLDGSAVGVGRPGIDMSETSIGIPCRTFGMLKHFEWSSVDASKNASGTLLYQCDAHAQVEKSLVYSKESSVNMNSYAYPPVSVVSSLFKCWRGSLEFKFDIIASQFHTGRLLCAYIPGFYGDASAVTMWQARNCPHVEFSLQDATTFTFIVPFISNAPMWPRKYTGPHKYGETTAPSKLVLYVLNPLVPMQSIIPKVVIVPYIRAGVDFEVFVPVQPAIGLSDNIVNNIVNKDWIFPTTGSYPFYATNYEGFGEDMYYILYEGTAAFGTASTFHKPEKVLDPKSYYYGKVENPSKFGNMIFKNDKGEKVSAWIGYIVIWGTEKGNYGIPFPDSSVGEAAANGLALALHKKEGEEACLKFCFKYEEDGAKSSADLSLLRAKPVYKTTSDTWTIVEPEMEEARYEAPNALQPTGSLASTSSGALLYNEKFDDLKDLARRYQLYADKHIKLPKDYQTGDTLAVFPVIPHGLALDVDNVKGVFNSCRDGHIPVISSGYIFFRGSIRFKLVFASDDISISGAKIWVQHHPDADCRAHVCEVYPKISEEDAFKSHSYASYIQNASVNSIIEFEIPFYQPGMYGITRKPASTNNSDLCQYYTLGSVVIGMYAGKLVKGVDIGMKVYYSIGDDFSFNVFRGFPMMVATDEVWPAEDKKKKKKITWITAQPEMEDVQPEMMSALRSYFVTDVIKDVSDSVSTAVRDRVETEVAFVKAKFEKAFQNSERFTLSVPTVTAAITNLLHVLANPTPKTVAISIANVVISFFSQSVVQVLKLIESFIAVITSYWHRFTSGDCADPQMAGMANGEDEHSLNSLCALIFMAVSSLVGCTVSSPKSFPDLLKNINSGVSLYNNSIRLVQNSADLIIYCSKYITCKLNPESAWIVKLASEVPEIQDWYKECNYLLDVRNKSKYLYDKQMMARVFDATVVGNLLVSSGLSKSHPGGKVIFDTHKEVRKLQTDLFERGAHPDVRFETYPIWISGEPGIGKSFMVKRVVNDLLKHVGYSAPGSLIYDIPSGAKYWSGCSNPAALVSDDLFQVRGQKMEEEIANIFMICSSSVLNPPMAAVEDKEKRLNPLLYVMLCNSHFPALSDVCNHPEAVYRRRKFLINVRLDPKIKEDNPNFRDASQLDKSVLANLGHLQFCYAYNVKKVDTEYTDWMSYEAFIATVQEDFKTHYFNERANFKQRMCDMYCLDPNFEERNIIDALPIIDEQMSLKDQIKAYKDHIALQLDSFNDPRREPEVWDYLRRVCKWFKSEPQMDILLSEASTSSGLEIFGLEQNYPDLFAFFQDQAVYFSGKLVKVGHVATTCDTAIKNAHIYLRAFCYEDVGYFDIGVQTMMDELFQHKLLRTNTWYSQSVSQLLDLGNFSTIEMLKFLSLFPVMHARLLALIFNIEPSLALKETDFVLGVNTETELANASVMAKADRVTYNNEKKKQAFREAIKNLDFESPDALRANFIRRGIRIIFDEFKSQMSACNALFGNATFFKFFESLAVEGISYINLANAIKYIEGRMDTHPASTISHCIDYVLRLYSLLTLSSYLFVHKSHSCMVHHTYDLICKNPRVAKFCSVRRKLEYCNTEVHVCSDKHCIYNNDLPYYFLAMASVGCGKFTEVSEDTFGRYSWLPHEFDDLQRALRVRTANLSTNIFARLIRWIKHRFFHVLPEALSGIYNAMKVHLPKVLVVMGLTAAASGLAYATNGWLPFPIVGMGYSTYKMGKEVERLKADKEGNYFKMNHPKAPQVKKPNLATKSFVSPQISACNRKVIASSIERNSCLIYATWIEDGSRCTRSARCLMLKGRAMLVLRHFIEEFEHMVSSGLDISFSVFYSKCKGKDDDVVQISVDWKDLSGKIAWCSSDKQHLTSNFGIVMLPSYFPQFKDITKRFASRAEHNKLSSIADLYVLNGESSFSMPLSVKNNLCVSATAASSAVYIDVAYSYNYQYKGLCGSVLVSANLGSGLGAIVGMHVAGSEKSGAGFAEPIYKEMFDEFFEIFPQTTVMPILTDETSEPDFELDSNLMVYGCVPPHFAHKESGKTKIVPSMLHGEIYPVRTEVNPLAPNDPRQPVGSHPLKDGCVKHGSGDVRVFESELVEEVEEFLVDRFQQIMRPVRVKVEPLTLQQAVCGDKEIPYFEPLNWKSSEGFPLSSHRPSSAHDKRWLFDLEETKDGYKLLSVHKELAKQLRYRDLCFKSNTKPGTIYIDCLKDYRLSPEKCAQPGKTRIFSIAPIQCTVDIKMYINDFCASIKENRIQNSIGIGINPDSFEWTTLVHYLHEVGTKIITLDYSNYGPCLMSQLVAAGNRVIAGWFKYNGASDEHVKRVEWLLDNDILNPVHLSGNVVYQTVNGISSGSPLTGECNSIPNLFYIRVTYLEIMRRQRPELACMAAFEKNVRLVVYGDDLIMSVSDEICEIFNSLTIRDSLAKHGIRVTPAQKTSEMVPYSDIREATFLKRSFTPHPFRLGTWLAPVESQSVEECINWVHASDSPQEALLEVCRASLDLAYGHGPDYYSQHYQKIKLALNKIGLSIDFKSWRERDREIFGDEKLHGDVPSAQNFKIRLPWTYDLSNFTLE